MVFQIALYVIAYRSPRKSHQSALCARLSPITILLPSVLGYTRSPGFFENADVTQMTDRDLTTSRVYPEFLELYLQNGCRNISAIEREMHARGHDFHRRSLYSCDNRRGWIEPFGWKNVFSGTQAPCLHEPRKRKEHKPTAFCRRPTANRRQQEQIEALTKLFCSANPAAGICREKP